MSIGILRFLIPLVFFFLVSPALPARSFISPPEFPQNFPPQLFLPVIFLDRSFASLAFSFRRALPFLVLVSTVLVLRQLQFLFLFTPNVCRAIGRFHLTVGLNFFFRQLFALPRYCTPRLFVNTFTFRGLIFFALT